ncbi:inositol oxygenase 1-like [Cryptomeria japonica]|uniref:inositol oxygenase 1-like n=1 Tax=Cryptomeria japonica TaxID=3369 RepID=UPI0025AC8206|nr:inositol oxygenase 1-like [Cryptomeria japonica]
MREKHLCFNKGEMDIWECAELLNDIVDESDPDLDVPQIEHLLQTAEAIRKDYPDQDWFHLTAFIHDLGKVLLHPKFGQSPQWAVVGDTFPVGCPFEKSIVHHQMFLNNPDSWDPKYNIGSGIYKEGCGFEKLVMSWGHDEYMYQVMKENKSTLPPQAYFIVCYHSFYAMHVGGGYKQLMNELDHQMLPWLLKFNKYDLYSKSSVRTDVEKLKPYYHSLIHKYFPDKVRW